MQMRMQMQLQVSLVVLIAGLSGLLYYEIDPPVVQSAVASPPVASAPPRRVLEAPPPPPLGKFDEIATRPLFDKTRRPKPKAAEDAQMPSNVPKLVGIVTGTGKVALLKSGDKVSQVSEGQTLDGWKIEQIDQMSIVITEHERRVDLPLKDDPAERKAAPTFPVPNAKVVKTEPAKAENDKALHDAIEKIAHELAKSKPPEPKKK